MSDLVTKLKAKADMTYSYQEEDILLFRGAADELQRLRTKVENLDSEADQWMRRWNTAVIGRQSWQVKAEAAQAKNARLREVLQHYTCNCVGGFCEVYNKDSVACGSKARAALAEPEKASE